MQYFFLRQPGWLSLLFALFSLSFLAAQRPTFSPPLKGPLLVTGTFGELRSNHFHAGLDFRGSVGTPVFAVGDGFVSRIKISAGGYGQAIYVDHPGGYRSVYCHLSGLRSDLMDTVRARQYQEESFGLELRFDSLAFPVRAGDRIGAVGNRGHSFGPHLHFEIRSSENDAPLNPLHFGIKVADTRRPRLRELKVYELEESFHVLRDRELSLSFQDGGNYLVEDGPIVVNSPLIGLGIKAYDRQNAMPNYNGIYAATLTQDSTLLHGFRYDSISYEETRYLNAHTDYAAWTGRRSWFHRLFRLPGDELSVYEVPPNSSRGIVRLSPGQPRRVEVEIRDWAGNRSRVPLTLIYEPAPKTEPEMGYQYLLPRGEKSYIRRKDLSLDFPENALYTDLRFRYQAATDNSEGSLSRVHHLDSPLTPLHESIQLTIHPTVDIPDSLRRYVVVARCPSGGNGRPVSYGPALDPEGSPVAVPVSSFGDFCLLMDTTPPLVEILSMPTRRYPDRSARLRISDDFGTSGKARGLRYRATLDGKWLLMEYDLKNNEIFHVWDQRLSPGPHELVVGVKDDRGNETIFRRRLEVR